VSKYFFRSTKNRILVAQLRLLSRNLGGSVMPAIVFATSLAAALMSATNWLALLLWCVGVIAAKLIVVQYAKRQLSTDMSVEKTGRQVNWLIFLNVVYGVSWGALAWVTSDKTELSINILMLAVLAIVLSQAVAVLSPVISIFIAFMLAITLAMLVHLWWINDLNYTALATPGFLYLIIVLWQARNSAAAARAAIVLGFENEDLAILANTARFEAEQANQIKAQFLAAASHDLRQPVHAQGLFLEILGGTELTTYQSKVLASARLASRASSEMLNALLDFSRIEAGVLEPHVEPFQLQVMLHKIEHALASRADAKNMLYRSRETMAWVRSDPNLVEIILHNLVSNAICYTDSGGVLIGCRRRGDFVAVEVWDTGIGIDASQQQSIFREFHQLGNAERDRRKGLGLGLAVAQGLAKVLGHELSLSSRPGRGSVFRLILPSSVAGVLRDDSAHVFGPQSLNGMHVLTIDDDEDVLLGMTDLLGSWGCTVDAANSIAQALALAQQRPPAIVISDYRLRAQRTGVQAVAVMRALLGQDLPALLISGDTAPERLRDALASGIPLMHKPVRPAHLFQVLAQIVNQPSAAVVHNKAMPSLNFSVCDGA
jgi:signal transduction histidine kinase/ActR/RegA family two-component response regulator